MRFAGKMRDMEQRRFGFKILPCQTKLIIVETYFFTCQTIKYINTSRIIPVNLEAKEIKIILMSVWKLIRYFYFPLYMIG